MLYGLLYLQWRLPATRASRLPRALLQLLLLLYAILCCCSRLTDNKHHPTDVLAGAVLGTSLAVAALSWAGREGRRAERVRSAPPGGAQVREGQAVTML